MLIDTDGMDAWRPDDPVQKAYEDGLQRAQGGRFDNVWKRARFYARHQIAEYALRRFPEQDIAECGCWWGHSTLMTADLGRQVGFRGRFDVFDSFEGLAEFDEADRGGAIAPDQEAPARARFASDYDHMVALTADYPEITLYRGWIPDRFPEVADRTYGFVHLDVDLYRATLDSLTFFYPRLVPGGAIFFDDYGFDLLPGCRRAVDEYLGDQAPQLFLHLPVGSAFLIK